MEICGACGLDLGDDGPDPNLCRYEQCEYRDAPIDVTLIIPGHADGRSVRLVGGSPGEYGRETAQRLAASFGWALEKHPMSTDYRSTMNMLMFLGGIECGKQGYDEPQCATFMSGFLEGLPRLASSRA